MADHEPQRADWSVATFDGNRMRQLREIQALPLSEKLARVEEMAEIVRHFAAMRKGSSATKVLETPAREAHR